MPFRKGIAISCDAGAVINDKKVTDHHAVIPTRNLQNADLSSLPVGERMILELVALRLLCAVAEPHTYSETAVTVECAGAEFTTKGKSAGVVQSGEGSIFDEVMDDFRDFEGDDNYDDEY